MPCHIRSRLYFIIQEKFFELFKIESPKNSYIHYLHLLCISFSTHIPCMDLRAKLLVACLVTAALWLNISDSRTILIIHFGLLLKERTLDSIGHDV